ncbi:MAG: glycosyltransferase family 39 protein [Candidatus Kerfeldbacteria bacterium]|nr:glycosyltransferase family 39 protein [Candidatus Kerfeldbacteria bacterium]
MRELTLFSQRPRSGGFALVLAIVTLAAVFLFGWKLGLKPLENWDEGIHAEVSREMRASGDWLTLTYRDQLYTAKPPLKFWLTAPVIAVLGETELAFRLWSALAGVLTTLVLTVWAWQWMKSSWLALLTGLFFVSGRFTLFHVFRTGETDGLLLLFFVVSLYAYWKSWDDKRWWFLVGAAVGLAIMTKSLAGALPAIIMAIDITWRKGWSTLDWKTIFKAVGLAAVIAVPWHLSQLFINGKSFWNGYFGFNVFERSSEVLYANQVPWYWYAKVMAMRTFPWGPAVVAGGILALRRAWWQSSDLDRLLLIWIAVVWLLFTLVQTKFDWYILPLYPGLALLLARGVEELFLKARDRLVIGVYVLAVAATAFYLPDGLAREGILWKMTPYAYLPEAASSVGGRVLVAIGVVLLIAALTIVVRKLTTVRPPSLLGALGVGYVLVIALGWYGSYLRHLPTASAFKTMAERVDRADASELSVIGLNLATQPAGYFYLRRIPDLKLREVRTVDELSSGLVLTTTADDTSTIRSQGRTILQQGNFVLLDYIATKP